MSIRKIIEGVEEKVSLKEIKKYPDVVKVFKHGAGYTLSSSNLDTIWITSKVVDALEKAKTLKEFEPVKV